MSLVKKGVIHLQARYRGSKSREILQTLLELLQENTAVTLIASSFRRYKAMSRYKNYLNAKMEKEEKIAASTIIQKIYRSYCAKQYVAMKRKEKRQRELKQKLEIQRQNDCVVIIQSANRVFFAKRLLCHLAEQKALEKLLAESKFSVAMNLQRFFRGFKGRQKANEQRLRLQIMVQQLLCTIRIQSLWRGVLDRRYYNKVKRLKEFQINEDKAKLVQRVWLGYLGRKYAKFLRGLKAFNEKEIRSAVIIQSVFRGFIDRTNVMIENKTIQAKLKETRSSKILQRIYRGYKGREAAHITKGLKKIQSMTDPLLKSVKDKEQNLTKTIIKSHTYQQKVDDCHTVLLMITNELGIVKQTNSLYIDSSIITGAPQRCEKTIIMVRLFQYQRHCNIIVSITVVTTKQRIFTVLKAALEEKLQSATDEHDEIQSILNHQIQDEKNKRKELKQAKRELSRLMSTSSENLKAERLKLIHDHILRKEMKTDLVT